VLTAWDRDSILNGFSICPIKLLLRIAICPLKEFIAMPPEEDEDLYDEEFDFVDEDDDEARVEDSDITEEAAAGDRRGKDAVSDQDEEPVDEYGRPEPAPNYVVHVYEYKKFKRTIDRPFTPEEAEAFATEYNRTSKLYGRLAVAGKNDAKPKKSIE
jgi:hypothetical protein